MESSEELNFSSTVRLSSCPIPSRYPKGRQQRIVASVGPPAEEARGGLDEDSDPSRFGMSVWMLRYCQITRSSFERHLTHLT